MDENYEYQLSFTERNLDTGMVTEIISVKSGNFGQLAIEQVPGGVKLIGGIFIETSSDDDLVYLVTKYPARGEV